MRGSHHPPACSPARSRAVGVFHVNATNTLTCIHRMQQTRVWVRFFSATATGATRARSVRPDGDALVCTHLFARTARDALLTVAKRERDVGESRPR